MLVAAARRLSDSMNRHVRSGIRNDTTPQMKHADRRSVGREGETALRISTREDDSRSRGKRIGDRVLHERALGRADRVTGVEENSAAARPDLARRASATEVAVHHMPNSTL